MTYFYFQKSSSIECSMILQNILESNGMIDNLIERFRMCRRVQKCRSFQNIQKFLEYSYRIIQNNLEYHRIIQNYIEENRIIQNVAEEFRNSWKSLEVYRRVQKFIEEFRSVEHFRSFVQFVEHSKCYFQHYHGLKMPRVKFSKISFFIEILISYIRYRDMNLTGSNSFEITSSHPEKYGREIG